MAEAPKIKNKATPQIILMSSSAEVKIMTNKIEISEITISHESQINEVLDQD